VSFQTAPLFDQRAFDRIIDGVMQTHLHDEGYPATLRDLWARHGLLIFKGVSTIDFQLELSRVFDPL